MSQDPADEPASALLERIRAERARLIGEKKIRAPKSSVSVIYLGSDGRRYEKRMDAKGRESEPICIDDEIPFDIPDSWEWARLESVTRVVTDGDHQAPHQSNKGIPFLVISDISSGAINLSNTRKVPHEHYAEIDASRKPTIGDVLLSVTSSFGIPVMVDKELEFCFQRHIALIKSLLSGAFLCMLLSTPIGL